MDITLMVMAAGMGSRFGGLKQIEPVGPNGESLLDYSVYDAMKAGFSKVVFIIKHEIEKDFRDAVGKRIEKVTDVDYAFQNFEDIPVNPDKFRGRSKPWGTGQAILSGKNLIRNPFTVINADDFYGKEAFAAVGDYLKTGGGYCMPGYRLQDTVTENGTVTRGVCTVSDGYLSSIDEISGIGKDSPIAPNSIVSMNMWGLKTEIFGILEEEFGKFFEKIEDPEKDEFLIPRVMNDLVKRGTKVRVLETDSKWLGMTYRDDLPKIKKELKEMEDMYK